MLGFKIDVYVGSVYSEQFGYTYETKVPIDRHVDVVQVISDKYGYPYFVYIKSDGRFGRSHIDNCIRVLDTDIA